MIPGFRAEKALEARTRLNTVGPAYEKGLDGVLVPQACGPCVSLPCFEFMGYRLCAPSGIDRWRPCVKMTWTGPKAYVQRC